jgi:imidazolonepropionase-like amidohydrolase
MATIVAAESVGAAADLGSLEPGKFGDVVLLDANPLEDISNTMKIWRVIKGGSVFDPATMRKLLLEVKLWLKPLRSSFRATVD